MRGGFPGLAIFSLLLLLLALGVAALVAWRPWEDAPIASELTISPGLGVSLGDAVVADTPPSPAVAGARIVVAARPAAVAEPIGLSDRAPGFSPAVSPARPVSRPAPATAPEHPVGSPALPPATPVPVATPTPVVAPAPAAQEAPAPQLVDADGSSPQPGRGTAGVDAPEPVATLQICDGRQYALGFAVYFPGTVFAQPGSENSIVRIGGGPIEAPPFALQLWDPGEGESGEDDRGLWSSGEAIGDDRFLAEISEGAWHRILVELGPSSSEEGFYVIYLDGQPIDVGVGIGLAAAGSCVPLEVGLSSGGRPVPGGSEVRVAALEFGEVPESSPLP